VNHARTDFDLTHEDAEAGDPNLFADEIGRVEIRNECIQRIEGDLADIIESLNEAKAQRYETMFRLMLLNIKFF